MIIIKIKGGLGNQLFQYASAKSLATELKTPLLLDLSFFEKGSSDRVFRLHEYNIEFDLASVKDIEELKIDSTPNFLNRLANIITKKYRFLKSSHWREAEFKLFFQKRPKIDKSIYLEGWFANPFYFDMIKDILMNELKPKHHSDETLEWNRTINRSKSVAIHIRRGDYLNNSFFTNIQHSYYRDSISYMNNMLNNPKFFFFSDDMDYVREKFYYLKNTEFVYRKNTNPDSKNILWDVEDLFLISQCEHQIIANSTYSWWGAWLNSNPHKIVIAPKTWYNDSHAQRRYENGTMVPKTWIKI